jgi:hypothetical protein
MSSRSPTLHNRMGWWKEIIEHLLKLPEPCWMNTRHLTTSGQRQSTPPVMQSTVFIFIRFIRRLPMSFLPITNLKLITLEFLVANASFLTKKVKSSKFAPRVDEGFLLGYASNAHGYRVFNNTTGLVEIAIDVTFDESNGSQGHISSDIAGNEILPNESIKKLAIGEVKPQEKDDDEGRIWMTNRVVDGGAKVVGENPSIQANPSTSSHPILEEVLLPQDMPTIVENEQEEVASEEPLQQDESDDQIQRHSLVPHPRVHQGIQRDHPVDNILGSIRRGVTT